MLESRGGIDQSAIKEGTARARAGRHAIAQRHGDGLARKGGAVDPRKRGSVAFQLLPYNATPRLLHGRMPAPLQLFDQGRFSTTRAPRNDHEIFQGSSSEN